MIAHILSGIGDLGSLKGKEQILEENSGYFN